MSVVLLMSGCATAPAGKGATETGPAAADGAEGGDGGADGADGDGGADGAGGDTGAPCRPPAAGDPLEVQLSTATVLGDAPEDGLRRFQGIAYASPPIGELRFRAPTPAPCVEGAPVPARTPPPLCPQVDPEGAVVGDEDCLRLSVWAPEGAAGAPVLLFLHGGGHEQGGASMPLGDDGDLIYDGAALARAGAVVVVAQYRLGALGFLALPELDAGEDGNGNWGTLDQLAALAWVRDEIGAFGGDPDQIALFGQSAGSVSACRVATSPRAAGQLAAAGLLSGACVATPLDAALAHGAEALAAAGCADLDCLRALPADALVRATATEVSVLSGRSWDGVIDGAVVPEAPRDRLAAGHGPRRLIISATPAETAGDIPELSAEAYEDAVTGLLLAAGIRSTATRDALLSLYPPGDDPQAAMVQLTSDLRFGCPAREDAAAAHAGGAAVHLLHWDERLDRLPEDDPRNQPAHGVDLVWHFGRVEAAFGALASADDLALEAAALAAWPLLAAGASPWAPWTPAEAQTWWARSPSGEVVPDPLGARCGDLAALLSP